MPEPKVARETEGLVLANVECRFQRVSKLFGSTLKEEQLEQVIYDLLQEKVKDCKTEILHGEGQRIYHQSGEHGRGTAASGSSTDGKWIQMDCFRYRWYRIPAAS